MNKTFKLKIFIKFILPTIAIGYFSYYFISIKYKELNDSIAYILTAKSIKSISLYIHNIQIERGLSSGYIEAKDREMYLDKLKKQQIKTDKAYESFYNSIDNLSKSSNKINVILYYKNKERIKSVLEELHKLTSIRERVLGLDIGFDTIISYYTKITTNLIDTINSLSAPFLNFNFNPIDIYRLEKLKDNAGLERAYIFNHLLSDKFDNDEILKIKKLIITQ